MCPQMKLSQNRMKLQIIIQNNMRCIHIFFDFQRTKSTIERKNKRVNRIIPLPNMLITLSALCQTSSETAEVRVLKSK